MTDSNFPNNDEDVMEDKNILSANILEDSKGVWGLYIVPDKAEETFINEKELKEALERIEASK